jgi:hypothetical protein
MDIILFCFFYMSIRNGKSICTPTIQRKTMSNTSTSMYRQPRMRGELKNVGAPATATGSPVSVFYYWYFGYVILSIKFAGMNKRVKRLRLEIIATAVLG